MGQGFCAGGHGEGAGIALLGHGGAHGPDDPGGTQNMIRMAVGNKHSADGGDGHVELLQPYQDFIAASGIHQELIVVLLQKEAGVVAFQYHGTARAEEGCFHGRSPFYLG